MVFVTGEAGAGKSRLIQEANALALEQGMAVLVGQCLDMDAPPPYQPLVELLDQARRTLAPEAFRELLGENAPEVARLMPELRQVYDDIGESPTLPPDQERRYLLHGFSRFVERAAQRRPLVLGVRGLALGRRVEPAVDQRAARRSPASCRCCSSGATAPATSAPGTRSQPRSRI